MKPGPVEEIGSKPLLWHIMKIYPSYGFNDFIICHGYKGYIIKEYFINYYLYNSDITVEVGSNKTEIHYTSPENFKITLIDTGVDTNTAGRLQNKVTGIINCCSGQPITVEALLKKYLAAKKTIQLNLGYYPYPDYEPMEFWSDNLKLSKAIAGN